MLNTLLQSRRREPDHFGIRLEDSARMGRVRTPITGRLRPLGGPRHAGQDHTFITPPERTPMTKCSFCGSDRPLTNEHVFPQWARGLPGVAKTMDSLGRLNKDPKPLNVVRQDTDGIYRKREYLRSPRVPILHEVKVKCVCADCNNGWMGSMEAEAARLFRDHTTVSKNTEMPRESESLLATWAFKTFLMYDQWYPMEDRLFPHEELGRYYHERTPSKQAGIWMGVSNSPEVTMALWEDPRMVGLPHMPIQEIRAGGPNIGSAFLAVEGTYFILHYFRSDFTWTEELAAHLITEPRRRLSRRSLIRIWPESNESTSRPIKSTNISRMEQERLVLHIAINTLGQQHSTSQ